MDNEFSVTGVDEYRQLALRTLDTNSVKDSLSPAEVQLLFQISIALDQIGPAVEGLKKHHAQGHAFPQHALVYGYTDFQPVALSESQKILLTAALGMVGESWEFYQLVVANILSGEELEQDKLVKEAGDVAWYLAVASKGLKTVLSKIFGKNIAKLKKAYPNGFDSKRSIDRVDRD